jgi:hypothetical protein
MSEPWPHSHTFVVVAVRQDGTRVYGCVGCDKAKLVSPTTDERRKEASS